jgi:di/tricarboxylate transporter
MVGLMVVHGAAVGNFSPLNVLSGIVRQALAASGVEVSVTRLFLANLACNVALAVVAFLAFGGLGLLRSGRSETTPTVGALPGDIGRIRLDQVCTLAALTAVAVAAFRFGLNIGFVALGAAVCLHLLFAPSSRGAETKISWSVVLLVCGIVTYVSALQRHGTVDAVGAGVVRLGSPLVVALLICVVAAVTSAFASSAGILGAMIPLAVPLIAQGQIGPTGLVIAIAVSATVVDATPFSTVGALVVANARADEEAHIYRGLLIWGAVMVVTAPFVTWLLFIVPAA